MKKGILMISLLTNIVLLGIYAKTKISANADYHNPKYFLNRNTLYNSLPIIDSNIVFIGDSQIQFFPLDEVFKNNNIKNRGINADYTIGLYKRMGDILKGHPKKLFIEIGTNDRYLKMPVDTSLKYFRKSIEKVKRISPNTQVYINTVFPRQKEFKNDIDEFNKGLATLSKHYGLTFINLDIDFTENGLLKKQYDSGDGLHLSGAGYIKWAEILKPYL